MRRARRRVSFRKRSRTRRIRNRALSVDSLKTRLGKAVYKFTDSMTPSELRLLKDIKRRYEAEVGKTPNRNLNELTPDELRMARISQQSYLVPSKRNSEVDDYILVKELSDVNSVVYEKGNIAIIGYRGTIPSKIGDLIADYHITFGTVSESKRFKEAETKYETVNGTGKYEFVQVTGHSLGGAQAIHVSKKCDLECWAWNPGQGVSVEYLNDNRIYPKIRTYHVLGDPISETAGLENPSGVYIFPMVSKFNPVANHSLDNFLR